MTIGGLTWDDTGKRYYYTGIDGVVLWPWRNVERQTTIDEEDVVYKDSWYANPIVWNGVTAINESPSGAESNKLYADNIEYLNLLSKEEFGCTIECYQTPKGLTAIDDHLGPYYLEGFEICDGMRYDKLCGKVKVHGQPRVPFGLVYRVQKGNDTANAGDLGYVYHIVYGCKASPSSQDHSTVNDSPEAQTFSYEITTTPLTDRSFVAGAFYCQEGDVDHPRYSFKPGNLPTYGPLFYDSNALPTNNGKPVINEVAHIEIDSTTLSSSQHTALKELLYGIDGADYYNLEEGIGNSEGCYFPMPTPHDIAEACGYVNS